MTNTRKAVFIMIIASSSVLFNLPSAWPQAGEANVVRDLKVDKEKVSVLLKEGHRLYRDGKYVEAGQSFRKILEINPNNGYASKLLRLCRQQLIYKGKKYLQELGDDDTALAYFAAAKEILPEKTEDIDTLVSGIELRREGSKERAIDKRSDVEKSKMLLDVDKTWLKSSIKNLNDPAEKEKMFAASDDFNSRINKKIRAIDFNNASLRDVLKNLSELTGVNIILDENALVGVMPEGLTVYLTDVSLGDAIEIILRSSGLRYRVEKNYILVTTPDKLKDENMSMKVYNVQDIIGRLYDFSAEALENQNASASNRAQNAASEN
jgi:tetratricopeptide (TPR) repeat protein